MLEAYSGVTHAAIAENVEQLGLDFRKMHDQAHDAAVNTVGNANATMVWLV